MDLKGQLWNVQRIYPNGDKRFLQNSRKTGLFFVLGELERSTLVFCEGYATGVTLFQATEYTTIVCFGAGNLVNVALEFRQQYPDKTLVIAGDNDFLDAQG